MSKSNNFLETLKILSESIYVQTNSSSKFVYGELISTSHSIGNQVDGLPIAAIRNQCWASCPVKIPAPIHDIDVQKYNSVQRFNMIVLVNHEKVFFKSSKVLDSKPMGQIEVDSKPGHCRQHADRCSERRRQHKISRAQTKFLGSTPYGSRKQDCLCMEKVLRPKARTHKQNVLPERSITFVPWDGHTDGFIWLRSLDDDSGTRKSTAAHPTTNATHDYTKSAPKDHSTKRHR